MTQEEAIKVIKKCKEKGFKYTFYTVNEYDTALDMAIKALRREDTFLNKVLEIIDIETSDPSSGEEGHEPMSYAAGWMACGFSIKDKVLALKGDEQE